MQAKSVTSLPGRSKPIMWGQKAAADHRGWPAGPVQGRQDQGSFGRQRGRGHEPRKTRFHSLVPLPSSPFRPELVSEGWACNCSGSCHKDLKVNAAPTTTAQDLL